LKPAYSQLNEKKKPMRSFSPTDSEQSMGGDQNHSISRIESSKDEHENNGAEVDLLISDI
jgi:hypothetical protein